MGILSRLSKNPIRAVTDVDIADQKQELYRMAFGSLAQNLSDTNWLTAIAIEESIISDRIESSMSKKGHITTLNTLGQNIKLFEDYADQSDPDYARLKKDLSTWVKERNYALHQIVKVELGDTADWPERISRAKRAAEMGEKLARDINNWSKRKLNR